MESHIHSGYEIALEENPQQPTLRIGGKDIEVVYDEDSGLYASVQMPYSEYRSLLELARDLIASAPEFRKAGL